MRRRRRRRRSILIPGRTTRTPPSRGPRPGTSTLVMPSRLGMPVATSSPPMIVVYFAMILFSSAVGGWVEREPNRLRTLLSTIVCNRAAVVLGSLFWLMVLSQENLVVVGSDYGDEKPSFVLPRNDVLRVLSFGVAVVFGILERLSASANAISMERDWVVTAAAATGRPYDLTQLNAVMRRIDLVCKLFAPILISAVVSAARQDVRVGVLYTGGASLACLPVEVLSARRVWRRCPALQAPKPLPPPPPPAARDADGSLARGSLDGFRTYFATAVWAPSLALALCHFNMLTWRATFITYLINTGYSLNVITAARAAGSLFEITSTVVTPRGVAYLGKTGSRRGDDEAGVGLMGERGDRSRQRADAQTIVGLQRLGLWGVSWQVVNTIPVVLAVRAINAPTSSSSSPPIGESVALFGFLAVSRLGVWVFDLTTQQLTQTLAAPAQRASFAGAENAVVYAVELAGAAAAVARPDPAQFPSLAAASLAVLVAAVGLYAAWLRGRRGHLLHCEKLGWGLA
ncbi:hypothetical protein F4780DRAFT_334469 [Xylariomycetidae sp. FL0641]|nr:hypothetical protein F4780DRAFT_334469 [Xylariomycetidae sp. FL0641]